MSAVLVAHVSADSALALRLSVDLRMSGIDVRIDEWEIEAGQSTEHVVNRGLLDGGCLCVLLSANSAATTWISSDAQIALEHACATRGIRLLTLLADVDTIPERLSGNEIFRLHDRYEDSVAALTASVVSADDERSNAQACAIIEHGHIRVRRMEPALHRVQDLVINIEGGTLRRTESGLLGTLYTVTPDRSIQAFCEGTRLAHALLTSDAQYFSTDAAEPTLFTGEQSVDFAPGERFVDLVCGEEHVTDTALTLTSVLEAKVYLAGDYARGSFIRDVSFAPSAYARFCLYGSFEFRIGV